MFDSFSKRIVLGDTTTHGGRVISASSDESYGPYQYARVGDHVFCPMCGSYFCQIERGPLDQSGQELPYAVEGQRTSCGATLVSRDSLGLIMREDGTIDCCSSDFTAVGICEKINKYKSGVTPYGPGGVFSYSGGSSSAPQSQPEKQESVRQKEPEKKTKIALYVDLKNEDQRLNEYLPFKLSVYPEIRQKAMNGKKGYVGQFEPGTYTLIIEPTPPPGETLGPVPYTDNPKFRHNITLSGTEEYLTTIVTRKESIEHNILMTFLVDDVVNNATGEEPLFEFSSFSYNYEAKDDIQKNSAKFSLDPDLVNAILYMETTHGYYDGVFDYFPESIADSVHKSIRPMNVNVIEWKNLLKHMNLSREDFYTKNWILYQFAHAVSRHPAANIILEKQKYNYDTNLYVGCFLLHRIYVRAKENNIETISTLYNSLNMKKITSYGLRVREIYNKRLWDK